MMRALIVDDEPLAREALRVRLALERDVELVGEARDGPGAVQAIRALLPDVVFLDVQMPGMNGFEVLEHAGGEVLPAVIFVTAYDRYALRAFEVHALDYLLKPFTADRLQHALDRLRSDLQRGGSGGRERVARLLDEHAQYGGEQNSRHSDAAHLPRPQEAAALERLLVRDGERYVLLRANEIDWIEAAANYVRLHARGRVFLVRRTIVSLAASLDGRQFVRIHRSTIVNVDRISEITPEWHGDFNVVLTTGAVLRLGRAFRSGLLSK